MMGIIGFIFLKLPDRKYEIIYFSVKYQNENQNSLAPNCPLLQEFKSRKLEFRIILLKSKVSISKLIKQIKPDKLGLSGFFR